MFMREIYPHTARKNLAEQKIVFYYTIIYAYIVFEIGNMNWFTNHDTHTHTQFIK